MAYTRINWQNEPSEATALNDVNLNKMDSAIYDHDTRLDTDESNITDLQSDVGDVQGDITDLQNGKVDKVDNYGLSLYKSFGYYQQPEGQRGTLIGYVGATKQNGQFEGLGDVYNGVVVDNAMSSSSENPVQNKVVKAALDDKVNKESGKGLSTLSALGVTASATTGTQIADIVAYDQSGTEYHNPIKNGVVVDSAISSSSENPVQNKVISEAFRDILPEETATGNPITITDGSDLVPATACKVTMLPIQDLHGYDYPWVGGAGKNKLPFPYAFSSQTVNGVTFTIQDDGGVKINGTATASTNVRLLDTTDAFDGIQLRVGIGSENVTVRAYSGSTGVKDSTGGSMSGIFTASSTFNLRLAISNGTTVNNEVIYPRLYLSTETDYTYAPYENICPISGRDSVTVTRTAGEDMETHTHTYASTVYGGVDDFVSGEGSNEWGYIASYNGETLPSIWLSDRDVYAPNTTPTTGAEVAYKLATPTSITNTPEDISLLKDVNVLSTDGDSLELKYSGEIQSSSGVDYSSDEQDTGIKWIDGKTIYQKTLTGVLARGEYEYYYLCVIGTLSNAHLIKSEGVVWNDTNGYQIPINSAGTTNSMPTGDLQTFLYNRAGTLCLTLTQDSALVGYNYAVTIYYTKA